MDDWRALRLDDLLPLLAEYGVTRFEFHGLVIERAPAPRPRPDEMPPPASAPRDATELALEGPPPAPGHVDDVE